MIGVAAIYEDAALLLTLGEVSELVSNSHDLSETLSNIVRQIQRRFGSDVCSVYTIDRATRELVLRATVGLLPESVGKVRMALTEGLVGLVAETMAPVGVENAPDHPRFRYFPESGEERYHSFHGVPLIQSGDVRGVLVVQHIEPRSFNPNETRMLVAVAAQIGVLVTNAQLADELAAFVHQKPEETPIAPARVRGVEFHGTAASPGYGFGKARCFQEFDFSDPILVSRVAGTREEERSRLTAAYQRGRSEIDLAAKHLAELLGNQFGELMQAQRLMLEDAALQRDILSQIDGGASVEQAVVDLCNKYVEAFKKLDNQVFYERIYDIKDVFRRLLSHARHPEQAAGSEEVVLVAHEVSLLELFASDLHRVRGILVEKGGTHSHVAILARSLGIPMVTHVPGLLDQVRDEDEIFIDAASSTASVNPAPEQREILVSLLRRQTEPVEKFLDQSRLPIRLATTVNLLPEVARTVQCGGEEVGLFRSEFLELAHRSFPTEEEQVSAYRKILSMLEGRPLTLRTLDLRSDKLFGIAAGGGREQCWDWRLVDQLPNVQEVIRTQIRAALRAACEGPLRILFPMITRQAQFDCAMQLMAEAKESLADEEGEFQPNVEVGIMIETAAASLMVRKWAPQVDFLCIGSNDLLHSFFGLERGDDLPDTIQTALDPNFLRTIRHIVKHAHAWDRPVTICGDAASNPKAALAFCLLEADALSVPPEQLQAMRGVFRDAQIPADTSELRRCLLKAKTAAQVASILAESLARPVLIRA